MIAICPAGPPKLMNPSLSQKRKASAKLARAGAPTASPILSGAALTKSAPPAVLGFRSGQGGPSSMGGVDVSLLSDSVWVGARLMEAAFFDKSGHLSR